MVGLAPLVNLKKLTEFESCDLSQLDALSLNDKRSLLIQKKIKFFIGNRDTRVSTEEAFAFLTQLADLAYDSRIRSPPFEMEIAPSCGLQGHGTLPHTFEAAAKWLCKQIVAP